MEQYQWVGNFLPLCCPFCGERLKMVGDTVREFFDGNGFTCKCGTSFQYVKTGRIDQARRELPDWQRRAMADLDSPSA